MTTVLGGIVRFRRNNFSRHLRLISRPWLSQPSPLPELSFLARIRCELGPSINSNVKSNQPTQSSPVRKEQRRQKINNITFIRSCLGLTKGTNLLPPIHTGHTKDTILLAVDTERDSTSTTEIGLTFLDTRDIQTLHPGLKALNWCTHFQSHHFSVTPTGSFLFGTSSPLPPSGLYTHISSLLDPQRQYILIGHSLINDLARLSKKGINIRRLPNVIAEIDTHTLIRGDKRIPQTLSGLWQHLSTPAVETLSSLSSTAALEQSGFKFHNAGNDAVYNLHALLMLAMTPQYLWVQGTSGCWIGVQSMMRYVRVFLGRVFRTGTPRAESFPIGAMLRRPRGLALRQPRQVGRGVTLRFTREVEGDR